jgi:toxin FitB
MILLDTNVVSALMRLSHEPVVAKWLAEQVLDRLFVTSPTIFEIRFGIEMKPAGKRKRALEASYREIVVGLLADRVVNFDATAAASAGHIYALQKRRGRNIAIPDCQIAGISSALGAPLATRDINDFSDLGIKLIDPWTASP